jgi:hypothetical protein
MFLVCGCMISVVHASIVLTEMKLRVEKLNSQLHCTLHQQKESCSAGEVDRSHAGEDKSQLLPNYSL